MSFVADDSIRTLSNKEKFFIVIVETSRPI